MAHRPRRLTRLPLVIAVVTVAMMISASVGTAQLGILPTPTPAPTRSPEATPPPAPTPTDETGPPSDTPPPVPSAIFPPEEESPTPKAPQTTAPADDATDPGGLLDDALPDALEEELVVPSFPRTRPRNTVALVKILSALTEEGIPLEQALIEGMGRFPVAGLAHYYDDWLNPRFTPKPHLHKGLDIFADFGTPIRAPDAGVVSQLSDHGAGGIAVWLRGTDGTSYYFAHLLERVEGIRVGQKVEIGTVIGFVGDTGNAQGGTPHLHFEIHPGGGEAVPPKPTVDAWLDEAEEIAPRWVAARRADVRQKGRLLSTTAQAPEGEEGIEASLLLTLLDPVGGSVGLLPSMELRPRRAGAVSDRLLADLIRKRVAGHLLFPSTDHLHHD